MRVICTNNTASKIKTTVPKMMMVAFAFHAECFVIRGVETLDIIGKTSPPLLDLCSMRTIFSLLLASAAATAGKWFDHVFIMQFENHAEDEVIKDPNFAKYTQMGRGCTNYYAVTHPSQPNYWAQVAGSYFDKNTDASVDLPYTNLVDLMDPAGVTWKAYQEDYPGNCDSRESVGDYYRKHNPFISFDNVRTNASRCKNIVNASVLDEDLAAGTLPQYSYYTPNINNDAHNTNITFGGKFLDGFLKPRLSLFPKGTLIVVSWDEDDYTEENKILVFFLDPGSAIFKPGTMDNTHYTHYSLLATVEANWNLGNLGRGDKGATIFNFNA